MQTDNTTNQKLCLKLIYPHWVKEDNSSLFNLSTKHKIMLSEGYKRMLIKALATNFLEDPCTEYQVLTRIWALELMEQGFFIFHQGLIGTKEYLLFRNTNLAK